MTAKIETVSESGAVLFIPLNKLKKSPKNARKTPHTEADIEALAASIDVKGLLQNLVVEPERDGDGGETGFYLVTIGEGRRLAQALRVKRKQIKKNEPIRCVLDGALGRATQVAPADELVSSLLPVVLAIRQTGPNTLEAISQALDQRGSGPHNSKRGARHRFASLLVLARRTPSFQQARS